MVETFEIAESVCFTQRREAVPYNYRMSYKISQICLILAKTCGRGGCSALKLHMVSHGLMSIDAMNEIYDYVQGVDSDYYSVRFDPAVNRGLNFCLMDGLVYQQANSLYRLTEEGKAFVDLIDKEADLLVHEKDMLSRLGNQLSEDMINALKSKWRNYAED